MPDSDDQLSPLDPQAQPSVASLVDRFGEAPDPRTLLDILRDTSARHPDSAAIDDPSGTIVYSELLTTVEEFAQALAGSGVRRGDRVGVRLPSGTRELYVAILGILASGAAYVPVDADDPQERADLVFSEAEVVGVVTVDGHELLPGAADGSSADTLFADGALGA